VIQDLIPWAGGSKKKLDIGGAYREINAIISMR